MGCTSNTLLGIALDCGNVGGLKKIYVANTIDVDTLTFGVDGELSGITMVTGKTFAEYSFRKGNASFVITGTRDDKQGTYFAKTDISVQFNRMDKAKRTELVNLVKSNCYVIIEDNNGEFWFIGKDSYVAATTGAGQSGADRAEGNFYNIVLSSDTDEVPNTMVASLITSII